MPHRPPTIGITTSLQDGEQRIRLEYVRAVERAGGVPLIVPMLRDRRILNTLIKLLDGLVITGGPAVTLGMVGELPADLEDVDPVRLEADVQLVQAFRRRDRPMLGICYGMQLLNAVDGGTIYADVQHQLAGTMVHSTTRGAADHDVVFEQGTRMAGLLGSRSLRVNSRHTQAVAEVAAGYRVAARASDGVIEAIESEDGLVLGVQFHPERMAEMGTLFDDFVGAAAQVRAQAAPFGAIGRKKSNESRRR